MTVFEKEMRKIFGDSEFLSEDTIFHDKTMISNIGKDFRAKVEFVYLNVADHYNALRLSIINRTEGKVDCEIFGFKDIIGKQYDDNPHIWNYRGDVEWYGYKPTYSDYRDIQSAVEDYIEMYADQDLRYEEHQTMGGM